MRIELQRAQIQKPPPQPLISCVYPVPKYITQFKFAISLDSA